MSWLAVPTLAPTARRALQGLLPALCGVLICMVGGALQAASFNGVNDRPFLDLMGAVEGPNGYNEITFSTSLRPERPLEDLTIREVMEFQRRVRASGANSSAMGRYQFTYRTLRHMVETMGIDETLKFDRVTQDTLARLEMRRCGFYEPVASDHRVANCLAAVWAALPLVTGPRAGQSRYAGLAGNRALVSQVAFMRAIGQRFNAIHMAGR